MHTSDHELKVEPYFMKLLLLPRQYVVAGQDFLVASMATQCGLSLLLKPEGRYSIPSTRPDLVVSINPQERCDADFLQAMFNSVPIVVHLHHQLEYLDGAKRSDAIRSLSFASAIVVPARFLRRKVQALFPHIPVHVVPNGVPERLFYPASPEERSAFRVQNGISPTQLLVGIVGPMTEAKGLQVIKSICSGIDDQDFALFIQYPDWQAITEDVGASYRRIASELKARSPAKIVLWPDSMPRFAPRPVRYLDVLIAPSLSEVQPLTTLEALVSGVPIIATRSTPFYEELLEAGVRYRWCRTIPLPKRFKEGSKELSRLNLTEEEAGMIAKNIIGVLGNHQPISDRARQTMARKMKKLGFSETVMCESFREIHAEAMAGFRPGSTEIRMLST
jgi:glycosyltransferase involved in cell wall biosynthesis